MYSKLKEKIDKAHQNYNDKINEDEKHKKQLLIEQEQFYINKIPEAKKWIEEVLFNLIAEQDLIIELHKKQNTVNYKNFPKELYLGSNVPSNIPVKSIVLALRDYEGLITRSESKHYAHPNDESNTMILETNYYVKW